MYCELYIVSWPFSLLVNIFFNKHLFSFTLVFNFFQDKLLSITLYESNCIYDIYKALIDFNGCDYSDKRFATIWQMVK